MARGIAASVGMGVLAWALQQAAGQRAGREGQRRPPSWAVCTRARRRGAWARGARRAQDAFHMCTCSGKAFVCGQWQCLVHIAGMTDLWQCTHACAAARACVAARAARAEARRHARSTRARARCKRGRRTWERKTQKRESKAACSRLPHASRSDGGHSPNACKVAFTNILSQADLWSSLQDHPPKLVNG